MKHTWILLAALLFVFSVQAEDALLVGSPKVAKSGIGATISFKVARSTDVEVAILNAKGDVVRHLAAGVLDGPKSPPEPLKPGLGQELTWDGLDDFGKTPEGGPFSARVRAGSQFKFDRLIGSDPYNFGAIDGIACDEDGDVYITGSRGESNQMAMCLRVFDSNGKYLREILPFPADLAPDSMKDIARWDADAKAFRPRNLRNLNPDFYGQPGGYWGNASLTLVSASKKNGVVLSNGSQLFTLEANGAVKNTAFASRNLGNVQNSGGGQIFLAVSPDAKWVYLSGPFSSKTQYGHIYDPNFPPGRVYRTALTGTSKLEEFTTVSVAHTNGVGGAWLKACSNETHFTVSKGPVDGVAVDAKGNVYVADRERQCIAVYDEAGKELGKVAIKNPFRVAVHPTSGVFYATEFNCIGYNTFSCNVYKFDSYKDGAQPVAKYEFPTANGVNRNHSMALSAGKDKSILWMAGVKGGLVPLEDKGTSFVPVTSQFNPQTNVPGDWNRLAADFNRDEIYVSNGTNRIWRYEGKTGEGNLLQKKGQPFYAVDLSIGYEGLLYARTGSGYSGALERLTRDLEPAPFSATNSNILSPYIYSRMGNGFAERGLGVGPDGKCYISFMYKWVAYAVGGFDKDGKPIVGSQLKDQYPAANAEEKKKYAPGMDGALTNQLPNTNGGIRVDLKGNLYVGMLHRPKDFVTPKGFEKDTGYRVSVGSVVKFPPNGGTMNEKSIGNLNVEIEGALGVYTGLAPFSSAREAFGANTCCVCRVPRFDIDRYGRLALPNSMTNSVLIMDNAGNTVGELGKYGNFDSQYVSSTDGKGKPAVGVPEIPLAWPTCAGFTSKAIYVLDSYNRRAVRVVQTYGSENLTEIK